jgi:undecaprenyl-diphosphatase
MSRAVDAVSAGVRRLGLTTRGLWLLGLAGATLAASATVLTGIGEDVIRHNGAATADPRRLQIFLDHRTSWLVSAARAVTALGTFGVLALIAIVAAAALWWHGQRLLVALAPAIALGTTGAIVGIVKQLVGRARPGLTDRLVSDSGLSFPSGHSADSTALFVTLAIVVAAVLLRKPLARALVVGSALLAGGLIGLTRLVLAAHWPTDVLAGWALGLFVAVAVGSVAALAARMTAPDFDQPHRLRARVAHRLLARRHDVTTEHMTT